MVRRFLLTAATLALAVSVAAQSPQGWKVRIDHSQNAQDPDNTPNLIFKPMGKGLHVKGGPAGTFWNGTMASGSYTLKATFNLQEPSNHTNYYGLVFGGSTLDAPTQAYVYFVVAQNGTFLVRQRQGEAVTDVVNRQANAAVRRPGANGQSSNALEVRVSGGTVSYVVNGTVVHSGPKGGLKTDGLVGVRVNHVLDVQFEGFEVGK
ncbi:MAG TPA: hypothetical protein VGQ37_04145 [Vicinamibacterales bacterium]|jgi:hypothetical protein|nr:hypothetical protein [Vicinamibacterales bacterium]